MTLALIYATCALVSAGCLTCVAPHALRPVLRTTVLICCATAYVVLAFHR